MSQFLHEASNFSVTGHTVNFVAGDQHTTNVNQDGSPDIISPGVLGQSVFDQYENVRRGYLRLLRIISSQVMDEVSTRKRKRGSDDSVGRALIFKRTKYHARIIGNRDLVDCVAVTYSDKDAHAAWQREFELFSNQYEFIY
ncbi:hypothetical protein VKT23_013631 [Stygiomarasmius scandens]|uniref:Uncharacterized protein n=1 Tax=Marasmiellus scandens TaxID=2682957 RepID=A0ABR1J3J6_9AGAR